MFQVVCVNLGGKPKTDRSDYVVHHVDRHAQRSQPLLLVHSPREILLIGIDDVEEV